MNRWLSALIIAVHLVGIGSISLSYNNEQINSICGDVLSDLSAKKPSESENKSDSEDSIFNRMAVPVPVDSGRSIENEENRTLAYFYNEVDASLNSQQFTFIKRKNDLIPPEFNPDILLLPS